MCNKEERATIARNFLNEQGWSKWKCVEDTEQLYTTLKESQEEPEGSNYTPKFHYGLCVKKTMTIYVIDGLTMSCWIDAFSHEVAHIPFHCTRDTTDEHKPQWDKVKEELRHYIEASGRTL